MVGPSSLQAQNPEALARSGAEPLICLLVGHLWRGDQEETRRIETDSVPQSYRDAFYATGCNYLIPTSLFDWHLDYGTADSIGSAFSFFEENYESEIPSTRDLRGALEQELVNVRENGESERWLQLKLDWERSKMLAEQYVRAAEFFLSEELRDRAEPHLRRIAEAMSIQYSDESDEGVADIYDTEAVRDLELRFAVLTARLSRRNSDIEQAVEMLETRYAPTFWLALGAYTRGDDFCDVQITDNDLDRTFEDGCDDDIFAPRVLSFWRHYSTIEALLANSSANYSELPRITFDYGRRFRRVPDESALDRSRRETWGYSPPSQLITGLFERHLYDGTNFGGYFRYLNDADILISLRIERADSYMQRASEPFPSSSNDLERAVEELLAAGRLALPFERAGRFRQIAHRFIALEQEMETRRNGQNLDLRLARTASYFRVNLERLNQIFMVEPSNDLQ